MKVVIDIPEEIYKELKSYYKNITGGLVIHEAIANGTPLPKGHGRLIDADALLSKAKFLYRGYEIALTNTIGDAPTIIEAEQEANE